jgi:glycosyltransferase involved in cell wall biosynthesis
VDTNLFSPGPESHPSTILSVGNLIPIKDHDLLLRAFAQVSATLHECRLEIIGDGPERERLVNLANELGVTDRVSFTGRLSREAVAEAMRRCTIFALPSSYEGLGCVYLEAMASAKPAIGCVGQGIDEIIESGKNGMLVSPRSLEELSSVLRTLLSNTDLRMRMGSAARTTILQKHTLEHQATQLTELYRECVA